MKVRLSKIAFTAGISFAMAFTFSCSGDSGSSSGSGGGGANIITVVYTMKEITDNSFTFSTEHDYYICNAGGVLDKEIETYDREVDYSINNNVLALWLHGMYGDSLNFNGTSNNLIGTWTRNKNKAASCEYNSRDDEWECKAYWDIVKAEATQTTFKITHDVCPTDEVSETIENGWRTKIKDCNTVEMSKDGEKITMVIKETSNSVVIDATYNNKTCKFSIAEPTAAQRQKACTEAWQAAREEGDEEYVQYYYWEFIDNSTWEALISFSECLEKNNFPEGFDWGEEEGDDYYGHASLAKKSGGKPALMKKNLFRLPRR